MMTCYGIQFDRAYIVSIVCKLFEDVVVDGTPAGQRKMLKP